MRTRTLSLLAVLVLTVAACGGATTEETTTTDAAPATTTTQAPAEAPDAKRLTYSLEAGTSYEYEVTLDQSIQMATEGDTTAMGDEEIPGDMSVAVKGTTTFSHSVAEGPEPDTYEITITGDFSDLSITGTVDGEPIDELPDIAAMDPIEHTVVVDASGRPIREDSDEFGDLFGSFGGVPDMGDLGSLGSGFEFSHVGPQFPDDELTVGDTWTDTVEAPMTMGEDPVTTEIVSTVTAVEEIDGAEVLVIETTSTTSAIEFDLAEFLIGFLMAFAPEGGEGSEDLEALTENLRFLFSIDETVNDLITWFDAEAGLARKADYSGGTHLVMDINMPDEESGEMIGFILDMTLDQSVGYRLLGAETPSA